MLVAIKLSIWLAIHIVNDINMHIIEKKQQG